MKKKRGPFWTTREGDKLALRDMETSHILNCMDHLRRRKLQTELRYLSLPEPSGEHAQDAFSQELDTLMYADIRDVFPIYIKFEEELARRKKRYVRTQKGSYELYSMMVSNPVSAEEFRKDSEFYLSQMEDEVSGIKKVVNLRNDKD